MPGAVLDWLFRDRTTGGYTVAQVPNAPLATFLVAAAVRAVASPAGAAGTALDVVAGVALAVWALAEVVRGVNPFRRLLGAGVLAVQVAGLL